MLNAELSFSCLVSRYFSKLCEIFYFLSNRDLFALNIQGMKYKQNVHLVCNNNLYFRVYERLEIIITTIIIIQHLHLRCHSFSILVLLSPSLKEFQFCVIP